MPGIVGLGAAAERCRELLADDAVRVAELRERLESGLRARIGGLGVNGAAGARLPGIANVFFEGVDAESLLAGLEGVAASSSAACTSASHQPSHVLRALGAGEERVTGSVRFSLGRFTTEEEIDRCIDVLARYAPRPDLPYEDLFWFPIVD